MRIFSVHLNLYSNELISKLHSYNVVTTHHIDFEMIACVSWLDTKKLLFFTIMTHMTVEK